jgi:hypothetical protein
MEIGQRIPATYIGLQQQARQVQGCPQMHAQSPVQEIAFETLTSPLLLFIQKQFHNINTMKTTKLFFALAVAMLLGACTSKNDKIYCHRSYSR